MSTKTSIKRIAAVAAVALTLGGFSAVSAHAAATTAAFEVPTVGVLSSPAATATAAAAVSDGAHYVSLVLDSSATDGAYQITTSGAGSLYGLATSTQANSHAAGVTYSNGANAAGGLIWYAGANVGATTFTAADNKLTLTATASAAGTQTITVSPLNGTSTGTATYTITWGAAPVLSVANSSVALLSTNTVSNWNTYAADDVVVAPNTYATPSTSNFVGAIRTISKNNVSPTAGAIAGDTITATLTGPGLLTSSTATVNDTKTATPAVAAARVATATTGTAGAAFFFVYADGTSGTATITLSDGTTVLGTKTITFSGTTPAKITATQNKYIATANTALGSASATAAAGAITVAAVDANGNPVASLSTGSSSSAGFYLTSDNTVCIATTLSSIGSGNGATGNDAVGSYELPVTAASTATSGCSANVTVNYYVSSTSTLTSAPIKFTVGGTTISTLALTTDSSSYVPGQKVTLTLTAQDSSGNAIADGSYGVWGNTATSNAALTPVTASAQLTSNPFAIASGTAQSYKFSNGVATATFFAPYTDGTVALTSTLGDTGSNLATALQDTTLGTSFAVSTGASTASQAAVDAANEATDAANAATDAANNAMDSADAAQQAALDAGDKADAALAAVTDLATKVSAIASQIASLSALVKKIAAKVKA